MQSLYIQNHSSSQSILFPKPSTSGKWRQIYIYSDILNSLCSLRLDKKQYKESLFTGSSEKRGGVFMSIYQITGFITWLCLWRIIETDLYVADDKINCSLEMN